MFSSGDESEGENKLHVLQGDSLDGKEGKRPTEDAEESAMKRTDTAQKRRRRNKSGKGVQFGSVQCYEHDPQLDGAKLPFDGPAIGLGVAELMLDGEATSVDLRPFSPARFT